MMTMPSLRQLRYLVALADAQHFSKAAEACFVSQSTLSAGIRDLEAQVGVRVAERTKRKVMITPIGLLIAEQARIVLREAETLMEIGESAASPMSGRLEVGVLATIAPFLLPQLLPQVNRRFPALKLALREDKTEALLERLAMGRLDLLLMAFPYDTEGCETFHLFEDRYLFACSDENPAARSATISADDVEKQPLLLLEREHCLHSHALPLLQRIPAHPQNTFSATSLHTLVAMVGEGMGATLLPAMAVRSGILQSTSVVSRPITGNAGARQIGLAWRKQSSRTAEFRELGSFIKEQLKAE